MVTITNISSEIVTIIANECNFRREMMPGRKLDVPEDAYNQLNADVGFQALVSMGYLKLEGAEDAEYLTPEIVAEGYDDRAIEEIMRKRDVTKFAQIIPKATPAMRTACVKYAIKYSVVDAAFSALLKKYCNVDILEAISITRDATEQSMLYDTIRKNL